MAVKTGVASQALGYVEEKLRRVFNLAGPIDASLDAEVKPVIIVDDLRGPGHAFYQGRSWAITVSHLTIPAGTKGAGFVFQDNVVIEGFDIRHATSPANSSLRLFIVTPAEQAATPPLGAGTVSARTATWRDNKTVGTLLAASYDQPPIHGTLGFGAEVGTVGGNGNTVWSQIGAGIPQAGYVPMQLHMPNGSGIYLEESNFVDLSFTIWGRVFPQ
jgi:hypothetical protein